MKKLLTLALIWLMPICSFADQNDARLDDLFSALKQAQNTGIAQQIEHQIWYIWLDHPDHKLTAQMQLGIQKLNLQAYADALQIFSQIIDTYPDYAEAWNKRATLYYLVGEFDAAIKDIEKTLQLEPRHFGALSGLGLIYIQRNELVKAKGAFEKLIEVYPKSPNAQHSLQTIKQRLKSSVI